MNQTAIVIPARLASTRLPGKVLMDINGKPMIQRVYERSFFCAGIDDSFVLTPDKEVIDVVYSFGGRSLKTGQHPTVLDRCAEGAKILKKKGYDTIVVVQGDEPMVTPEMIKLSLDGYKKERHTPSNFRLSAGSCLYKKISKKKAEDINTVKCVFYSGFFIPEIPVFRYLSRSIIPGTTPEKDGKEITEFYKQVCVMAFDINTLIWYGNTRMSDIEKSEGIDLLRFVLEGIPILAVESFEDTQAVDTQEDLEKVRKLLKNETTK